MILRSLAGVLCLIALGSCASGDYTRMPSTRDESQIQGVPVKIFANEALAKTEYVRLAPVSALSCKYMMWDSTPSEFDAIAKLRFAAGRNGANGIAEIVCRTSGATFVPNCWASVECNGVAIRVADTRSQTQTVQEQPQVQFSPQPTVVQSRVPSASVVLESGVRHALVIGNGSYRSMGRLKNPTGDARAIASVLSLQGFAVTTVENADRATLGRAVIDHAAKLRNASAGVVFFAGHGIQVRGVNYLMPVEANPRSEGEVDLAAISLPWVMQQIADSGGRAANVLILDACRNNPVQTTFRSASRGLAVVGRAPGNMLVLYATAPDDVAADGDGANGLFTTELLREIDQPGVPVELMFKRVVAGVRQRSAGAQVPWMTGSLEGDFVFRLK